MNSLEMSVRTLQTFTRRNFDQVREIHSFILSRDGAVPRERRSATSADGSVTISSRISICPRQRIDLLKVVAFGKNEKQLGSSDE